MQIQMHRYTYSMSAVVELTESSDSVTHTIRVPTHLENSRNFMLDLEFLV